MKPMRTFLIPAAMIAALALPAVSLAQTAPNAPPSQGQTGHSHRGGFMHAMKNLNLSADQKSRIDALMTAYHQAHPKGSAHDPAAMKALHDQVLAILTPAQQTQLKANMTAMRQRTGETAGANGQDNDDHAGTPGAGNPGDRMMQRFASLNLSDSQKTQIQNLVAQFRQAHPQGSPRDPQAMKTLHDQINAVLTPQQQQQMQAMRANHEKQNGNGQPPKR